MSGQSSDGRLDRDKSGPSDDAQLLDFWDLQALTWAAPEEPGCARLTLPTGWGYDPHGRTPYMAHPDGDRPAPQADDFGWTDTSAALLAVPNTEHSMNYADFGHTEHDLPQAAIASAVGQPDTLMQPSSVAAALSHGGICGSRQSGSKRSLPDYLENQDSHATGSSPPGPKRPRRSIFTVHPNDPRVKHLYQAATSAEDIQKNVIRRAAMRKVASLVDWQHWVTNSDGQSAVRKLVNRVHRGLKADGNTADDIFELLEFDMRESEDELYCILEARCSSKSERGQEAKRNGQRKSRSRRHRSAGYSDTEFLHPDVVFSASLAFRRIRPGSVPPPPPERCSESGGFRRPQEDGAGTQTSG